MKKLLYTALISLFVTACGDASPDLTLSQARILMNPVQDRPAGGYFTITNQGNMADELLSVKSPDAGRIEIHNHVSKDGVMHMERVKSVTVAAHGHVNFERGGFHLMLFDLGADLQKGGKISLQFEFAQSGVIETKADIEGLGQ